MKQEVEFEYFHGYEAEQFAFYRIPKLLFTDNYFRGLSSDAKILYRLMAEIVGIERDTINIAGVEYPYQFVKGKLLKIGYSHIQYVLECLNRNTTKIHNIKAYLLTCLFNAPSTISSYYRAEVNHDMYGVP